MSAQGIAVRYAGVLFDRVSAPNERETILGHLEALAEVMRRHDDLERFLLNPDVEVDDKLGVLTRALGKAWPEDLSVFLRVVLSMGRAQNLQDIAAAFRTLVDADRRRVRVTVRTARPLSAGSRVALIQRLEAMEQRRVELAEAQEPSLIGGLQVLIDHRLLDGSLKARLSELRQRLKSVKVH